MARGVSKQAISKRVAKFVAGGQLRTRKEGRALLVHVPTYDALADDTFDPAQELRNRHQKTRAAAEPAPELPPDDARARPDTLSARRQSESKSEYDLAKTRQANAQASLAEIELRRRAGDLCDAAEVAAAAASVADLIANALGAITANASKIYSAGRTGGEAAVMIACQSLEAAIRRDITAALLNIADDNGILAPEASAA